MNFKRIAIVKLSSLGDIIHTLPALSVIRSRYPGSEITWFVSPPGAKLLENFTGIDNIVPVNIKNGSILKRIKGLKRILSVHRCKYDIIFDFQGLIKSAILSRLIGKYTVGFNKSNLREPVARYFYRDTVSPFNEKNHVIKKNLHLLSSVGIDSEEIIYPVKELICSERLKKFFSEKGLEAGNYVVLNIGGGWDSKLLSQEQNIEILNGIDPLKKKVILWGNEKEEKRADMLEAVTGEIKSPFLNFSELIFFIKGADVLISSDSLPLHIADVTGTRSVGIFGPTSPERNGSMNDQSKSVVNIFDCSFCYKRTCSHKKCIKSLDLSLIGNYINGK